MWLSSGDVPACNAVLHKTLNMFIVCPTNYALIASGCVVPILPGPHPQVSGRATPTYI